MIKKQALIFLALASSLSYAQGYGENGKSGRESAKEMHMGGKKSSSGMGRMNQTRHEGLENFNEFKVIQKSIGQDISKQSILKMKANAENGDSLSAYYLGSYYARDPRKVDDSIKYLELSYANGNSDAGEILFEQYYNIELGRIKGSAYQGYLKSIFKKEYVYDEGMSNYDIMKRGKNVPLFIYERTESIKKKAYMESMIKKSNKYIGIYEKASLERTSWTREEKYDMGIRYYSGYGEKQNMKEAARLIKQSAKEGYYKAQLMISYMYEYGKYFQADTDMALMWTFVLRKNLKSDSFKIDKEEKESTALITEQIIKRAVTKKRDNSILKSRIMADECVESNYKRC